MADASDLLKSPDGRKNIYTCGKCRGHIVTRDRDEGTTPFMLSCKVTEGCDGRMESSFYRVWDGRMAATHEWYRPASSDGLNAATKHHVDLGGLLLRKIGEAANG